MSSANTGSAAEVPEDKQRLVEILERALLADGNSQVPAPEELEALKVLARRHRDEPLVLEPVARELVEIALNHWMPPPAGEPGAWRRMAGSIAKSLMEDQGSKDRLMALWRRLVEET